jgi:nitrogen fixation NifU-like protein
MTAELRELYQEVIIDHGRHPRNFGALSEANHHKEGFNPLCGDKILMHVQEKNGILQKIQFEGSGCAISIASASLLTEVLQGKTIKEVEELFDAFHYLVTEGLSSEKLGKLAVLAGVHEFPARVKCATLAWHTLKAAIADDNKNVTTEESI